MIPPSTTIGRSCLSWLSPTVHMRMHLGKRWTSPRDIADNEQINGRIFILHSTLQSPAETSLFSIWNFVYQTSCCQRAALSIARGNPLICAESNRCHCRQSLSFCTHTRAAGCNYTGVVWAKVGFTYNIIMTIVNHITETSGMSSSLRYFTFYLGDQLKANISIGISGKSGTHLR